MAAGIILVPKLLDTNGNNGAKTVSDGEQDPLLAAVAKCDPVKRSTKLEKNNSVLVVDGAGEKSPNDGLSESSMTCVLDTLQVPGALSSRMYSTVHGDGQLQGDWPGFTVTWTNDKAQGLDLRVTRD
ncbi:hypothetical protein [Actinoplanes sp. NPDC026623]|uniref:hypothetical protein n=1 Tax=Actinoplanes sp. NPDC026623 TaxID=3155610 RepID=UPI0033D43B67